AAGAIDHAIVITDARETVLYCNRAFLDMFGYSGAELTGRQATELLAAEGFELSLLDRMRSEVNAGRLFEVEIPVRVRHGEAVWMSAVVKPLNDEDGRLTHCLIVLSDIS